MDLVLMGNRDARRLGLIQAALQGKVSNGEAAAALRLSVRQFRRLRRQVRERGARGVVHGNRGRPSVRRLSEATRQRVHELLTGAVKVNDHHLAELVSDEGLPISAASVRRERRRLKLAPKRQRRPPRHRRRRERAARRGALVLIDASPFAWFAELERYDLVGALDDATGEILALTFRPTEDLHGYAVVLRDLIQRHGVPVALYGDRSSILVRNDSHWTVEEQLAGQQSPPQFGQMLEELAIRFIAATSPQAKGRIERLWHTLQDRLVVELRLKGLLNLAAATAYLAEFIARHNRRWAIAPREAASALRAAPRDLDHIVACRYLRVVARDNTVSIPGRWVQVPPGPHRRSWHRSAVEARELLDGRLLVIHPRHGVIAEQAAPEGPFHLRPRGTDVARRARTQSRRAGESQAPDRPSLAPQTRPRSQGIGTLTNIRRPSPDNPWKRYAVLPNRSFKAPRGGT